MESQNYWRKKKMKKKVLLIALLVALILAPVTAASYRGSEKNGTFGVGLNLGTNTGVGLKFGMGDFDILANIGLSNFQVSADRFSLAGDIAASYEVYDVDFGKGHHMPITVGGGVTMGFTIGEQFGLDLSVVVPVGVSYQIPDFPMQFYLRLAPGLMLLKQTEFKLDFGFAGYIGALWMF